jgi:hypothetical protein
MKKEARNKMLERKTRRTMEEYRIARNKAKNMCRKKNKLFQENILQGLQDKFRRNEIRKYCESIHNINMASNQEQTSQDKLENLVAGNAEVLNRWKEYSEEHLNSNVIRNLEDSVTFIMAQN